MCVTIFYALDEAGRSPRLGLAVRYKLNTKIRR